MKGCPVSGNATAGIYGDQSAGRGVGMESLEGWMPSLVCCIAGSALVLVERSSEFHVNLYKET